MSWKCSGGGGDVRAGGSGEGGVDNRKQRILLCDVTSRRVPNARSESDVKS